jgi:hypothetical protein
MSDMVLRNAVGAFEVYDISANKIMSAASLGSVGTDWKVAGFASDPANQSTSISSQVDKSHLQLVQAMSGFSQGAAVTSPIALASSDPMAPNGTLSAYPLGGHG